MGLVQHLVEAETNYLINSKMAKKPTIVALRTIKTGKVDLYEFPSKKNATSFTDFIDEQNKKKEEYQYLIQI